MCSSLKCKFYKIYQNKLLFLAVAAEAAAVAAVAINSHIFASITVTSKVVAYRNISNIVSLIQIAHNEEPFCNF